ncbi:3-oxoacyl-[acyl-carrier-protein] reductase FabG [Symmachiella macrocystis]|uniref:3-oxoacyl-[acyl-carrier-protein] reductase FabG n=1 Tax=Symmachiella macrocystis TaxID=2527985 RepID=A0A5C6BMC0_9PLAN|nr:glucose 1-dehydrogenase [Symmachiella macrocystis]TWU12436.1 3-oxoacyl-[acyl-carrier-protein] reductase FabG [Symmachiella macrocystis]
MNTDRKIALVTGASKGVGRGIAVGLARDGWDVAVNFNGDRNGAAATAAAISELGRQAWVLQGDIGYRDQVESMFAELEAAAGTLDLLVNNAGVQTWAPLLELTEEDFDRTIRTNLKGTFLCTQAAARHMKDSGGGGIINIGSGANKTPFPNLVDYSASKGGIENLTRVSAVELGPHGIRVNCVAPGAIEIERTKLESGDYSATWSPLTPMRRVGQVDDVAKAVVYLAGDGADFITGQTVYVDGGLWSQGPWPY